jgi:hypothetical protein
VPVSSTFTAGGFVSVVGVDADQPIYQGAYNLIEHLSVSRLLEHEIQSQQVLLNL